MGGNTLVHNADGIEMHFAVNVVAPWKLTLALLSNLKAAPGARVLNITGGDKPAAVDPSNLQAEKKFRGLMTYTHSKSVLEAMSVILSKKLEPEGVTVNIAFPGRASTAMTQSLTSEGLPGPMKIMMPFFKLLFKNDGGKSALGASKSTVFGAVDPSLNGVTGRYYDTNCKEQKFHKTAYDESVHQKFLKRSRSIRVLRCVCTGKACFSSCALFFGLRRWKFVFFRVLRDSVPKCPSPK